MKKKIFITGGGGYCGSVLVPLLLNKNYQITVFDNFYFGNFLPSNKKLKIVKGDIRDINLVKKHLIKHDILIHLACISNDSSFELNKKLSKTINYDAFEPLVIAAKELGIKRFIYASSSSVYGISKKKNVKENHKLLPLTYYNKYKALCEPILFKHTNQNFTGVIFRPATVCGYSPRQRFDLTVNILTNNAIKNKKILVFGGNQLRPNLHIKDYCNFVIKLINAPKNKISNEIFNIGEKNLSIKQIALIVKNIVKDQFKFKKEIEIKNIKSNDKRSYHINSDKASKILKFTPKYSIEDAIIDLCIAFKKKKFYNSSKNINYFNVKKLIKIYKKSF